MFNRYHAVFRSRWRALLWASGVLLTAYCTIPAPGEKDVATTMVEAVAGPPADRAPAKPRDPWALEPAAAR
jgi:hypothetical protein